MIGLRWSWRRRLARWCGWRTFTRPSQGTTYHAALKASGWTDTPAGDPARILLEDGWVQE